MVESNAIGTNSEFLKIVGIIGSKVEDTPRNPAKLTAVINVSGELFRARAEIKRENMQKRS